METVMLNPNVSNFREVHHARFPANIKIAFSYCINGKSFHGSDFSVFCQVQSRKIFVGFSERQNVIWIT